LVSFDCSLVQSLIVGDHLMLLGRVDAVLAARTDQPLLYSEGRYHGCTELRAG
jgi:flavin reductase (DIM6/NTAB) family NADH-FMN oxidoreductase RutF